MSSITLLALRHDASKRRVADVLPPANGPIPNTEGKGVVGFCDGHSDYIERTKAHSKWYNILDPSMVPDATLASWP